MYRGLARLDLTGDRDVTDVQCCCFPDTTKTSVVMVLLMVEITRNKIMLVKYIFCQQRLWSLPTKIRACTLGIGVRLTDYENG